MRTGVVWITGFSGVGKSTLAHALIAQMEEEGHQPILLDGDEVREAVADENCGHDASSRLINAFRISRLAKMLSDQNRLVIVATMSLFHEIHAWNKANFSHYFEIFLDVPIATLKERDTKNLYALGKNLPGVDLAPELPLAPNMCIKNSKFERSPLQLSQDISKQLSNSF